MFCSQMEQSCLFQPIDKIDIGSNGENLYLTMFSTQATMAQCHDIHLYNKASFPHFRWERGFDPLFDPAWKRSEWKQWKVYFRIVSKSYTTGQKRAGKCHLEFLTASTDQKAGGSNPSGRTKTREKPCVSCGFCLFTPWLFVKMTIFCCGYYLISQNHPVCSTENIV